MSITWKRTWIVCEGVSISNPSLECKHSPFNPGLVYFSSVPLFGDPRNPFASLGKSAAASGYYAKKKRRMDPRGPQRPSPRAPAEPPVPNTTSDTSPARSSTNASRQQDFDYSTLEFSVVGPASIPNGGKNTASIKKVCPIIRPLPHS